MIEEHLMSFLFIYFAPVWFLFLSYVVVRLGFIKGKELHYGQFYQRKIRSDLVYRFK